MALGLLLAFATSIAAQTSAPLDSLTLAGMRWRSIGPANMTGRISDIEGVPFPSRTFYVASAAGGIWKTTNAGTTFKALFQNEKVVSIGDVAIAPSDSMRIYVGTGEESIRNSVSPGGGFYRSDDGGESWQLMGLEKTETIGRVVVHPTNPDVVYVAASGAIWRTNPERGLYKTTDGGRTWTLSKSISDRAGFVDVAMDPSNPEHLIATAWERIRGPYFLQSGGPGSGIWRTRDGGATWTQMKGGGLPESNMGRVGLSWSRSHPNVIYAMIEADTLPNARPAADAARQTRPSGLWKSTDAGETWTRMQPQNVRPFYYSQVRVHPTNPDLVWWSSTPVNYSEDGGVTARTATVGLHVDHHAHWIDPNNPEYHVVGNDGGIGVSHDGGRSYIFANSFVVAQFYNVSFDMRRPYYVCGGLQDNGTWCGPSRRQSGSITNTHWYNVGGGDGFGTQNDPTDPHLVYGTSQGGNMYRLDITTGERTALGRPQWRPAYNVWMDSIAVALGGALEPSNAQQRRRVAEFQSRATQDSLDLQLRWNWNTPFFLSHHNPQVFYAGSNRVVKSMKRGDDMYPISPDLTTIDTMAIRIAGTITGGITPDVTGAERYSTIASLAESPLRPGLLYAGTDDGNVWITRNGGGAWENLTANLSGVPAKTYVSRIEPSWHDPATVYVTFDNHRRGDFTPYVYVSNDYGKSFRSIVNNLPRGGIDFVHVIREDLVNPNLLFVGTDVGLYASLDRGASWQRFMTGFPTVPVHDLKIHPRDRELIAGTHGRGIWIVDITPLQQMTDAVAAAPFHLFEPKLGYQFGSPRDDAPGSGDNRGHLMFRSITLPYGAEIVYRVAAGTNPGPVRITISDAEGEVRTLNGPATPGLHRVFWNYQGRTPPRPELTPGQRRDSTLLVARMAKAIDSLVAAGGDRTALENARTTLLSGSGIGGGGGGGGGGFGGGVQTPGVPDFNAAPGIGPVLPAGGGGGGGGGGGFGGQMAGTPLGQLVQALGGNQALAAALGGGGGFGGGGAQPVAAGTYLVTIEVGGVKHSQPLKVEGMQR
jgi:photosystem II stability/assembly factor-like uncharacterized protein